MQRTLINIERKLAVINGFVEIPDARLGRTSLTPAQVLNTISGSSRTRVGVYKIIDQEWAKLPEYERTDSPQPPSDYFGDLRDAAGL